MIEYRYQMVAYSKNNVSVQLEQVKRKRNYVKKCIECRTIVGAQQSASLNTSEERDLMA